MNWTVLLDWRLWLGLAFVALGAAVAVQTARLSGCRESLDAAQQKIGILGAQLAQQNAAVEALKQAGDAKVKQAENGLIGLREPTKAASTEAARLRAWVKPKAPQNASSQAAPKEGVSCPPSKADRAAALIREGLR